MRMSSQCAKVALLSAVAVVGAQVPGSGWAQGTPGQARGSSLEEIVVTAQRRAENLQQVPISITHFGQAELAATNADSFRDIQYLIPNVGLAPRTGNAFTAITIRGIGTGSFDQSLGTEPSTGVYVDGVYTGRKVGVNLDLADVERIEVLRGPQGTLFGRNTIAGAVSFTTVQPDQDLRGMVEAGYGRYNQVRARGWISGPLVDEKLFGKISAFSVQSDGYIRNLLDNSRGGEEDRYGGRLQLRALASENLEVKVGVNYLKEDQIGEFGELEGPDAVATGQEAPFVVNKTPALTKRELFSTFANADWRFAEDFTLTSITAYSHNDYFLQSDDDGTPLDLILSQQGQIDKQFSQELRVTSPKWDRFDFVAGLYFIRQKVSDDSDYMIFAELGLPEDDPITNRGSWVKSSGIAGFFHGNYRVTEALSLNAGIRYSYEKKRLRLIQDGAPLAGIPDIPLTLDRRSEDAFSPTAGINYQVSEEVMTYARFSRGFKAGGYNTTVVSNTNIEFDPEYASNFEVGVKSTLFDDRLRLNVALFWMDYSDIQVFRFEGLIVQADNAAKATSKGVEVDMHARLMEGLDIFAGLGYNKATYDRFPDAGGPGIDYDGNYLVNAPKWTASTAVQYGFPVADGLELSLRGEYTYRSATFQDPSNAPINHVDSISLVNARVSLESEQSGLALSAWVRNLTNNTYKEWSGSYFGPRAVYGQPRTYGVEATWHF